MAHETEGSLLQDIYKGIFAENAQQLFNAVRRLSYPATFTQFPELDNYILQCAKHHGLVKNSPLNPGDVIEVQGPAVSGKTHFLYHLAAHCLLPEELPIPAKCTVHLGGYQSSVVVFDCDNRWNLSRLYAILITRLNMACNENNAPFADVSVVALQSLSRLHVFRPQSSIQLAATLENLSKYHMEKMPEEDIRFLFVDSISSFYWMDRWQLEPSASKTPSFRPHPQRNILRSLQSFKLSHAPIIILTNWEPCPTGSDTSLNRSPNPLPGQSQGAQYPSLFNTFPRSRISGESLHVDMHITLVEAQKRNPETLNLHLEHEEPESFLKEQHQIKEDTNFKEVHGHVRISSTDDGASYPNDLFGTFKFRILKRDVVAAS